MTKPRKPRTDSTSNLIRIYAGANTELAPPKHVPITDDEFPYWHNVLGEFAVSDWTPHALDLAAIMCRDMAALEAEQRTMRVEGTVLVNGTGNPVANPRLKIVAELTARILACRRSLGLTARAKAGGTQKVAHQRSANRAIEQRLRPGGDRSDLLA